MAALEEGWLELGPDLGAVAFAQSNSQEFHAACSNQCQTTMYDSAGMHVMELSLILLWLISARGLRSRPHRFPIAMIHIVQKPGMESAVDSTGLRVHPGAAPRRARIACEYTRRERERDREREKQSRSRRARLRAVRRARRAPLRRLGRGGARLRLWRVQRRGRARLRAALGALHRRQRGLARDRAAQYAQCGTDRRRALRAHGVDTRRRLARGGRPTLRRRLRLGVGVLGVSRSRLSTLFEST